MEISVTFSHNGKTTTDTLKNTFVASVDPPYLGVILKPGTGVWEYLKNSDDIIIDREDSSLTAKIKYRIDVGESSIFFLTSDDQDFSKLF